MDVKMLFCVCYVYSDTFNTLVRNSTWAVSEFSVCSLSVRDYLAQF